MANQSYERKPGGPNRQAPGYRGHGNDFQLITNDPQNRAFRRPPGLGQSITPTGANVIRPSQAHPSAVSQPVTISSPSTSPTSNYADCKCSGFRTTWTGGQRQLCRTLYTGDDPIECEAVGRFAAQAGRSHDHKHLTSTQSRRPAREHFLATHSGGVQRALPEIRPPRCIADDGGIAVRCPHSIFDHVGA